MKRTGRFRLYFSVFAVLFSFVLAPGRAEAAGYKRIDLYGGSRVKVGSTYFWGKRIGGSDENGYRVYASGSASDKKGTAVATAKVYWEEGIDPTLPILTDGTRMYYVKDGSSESLCGIDVDGKNSQKYDTGQAVEMLAWANNRIYYAKRGDSCYTSFYSVSAKTKKKTALVRNYVTRMDAKDGRYSYFGSNSSSEKKTTVSAFDWEKMKMTRTYRVKNSGYPAALYPYVTAKYSYWVVEGRGVGSFTWEQKIYRCRADGKGSLQLVATLSASDSLGVMKLRGTDLYYTHYNGKKIVYYRYNFSQRTSRAVSKAAYDKISENESIVIW